MGEGLFYSRRILTGITPIAPNADVVYMLNTAGDLVPWQTFGNFSTFQISVNNVQSITSSGSNYPIFHGRDQNPWGGTYAMYITPAGDLILYRERWEEQDEAILLCPQSAFNFDTDNWVNISVVFLGNDIHTYINGELKHIYLLQTVQLNFMRVDIFRLANATGGGQMPGLAAFSEARFWSTALTSADIADNWNRRICPSEYGDMIMYLPFDSLTNGNRVEDVITNGATYLHLFGTAGTSFYVEEDQNLQLTPC